MALGRLVGALSTLTAGMPIQAQWGSLTIALVPTAANEFGAKVRESAWSRIWRDAGKGKTRSSGLSKGIVVEGRVPERTVTTGGPPRGSARKGWMWEKRPKRKSCS